MRPIWIIGGGVLLAGAVAGGVYLSLAPGDSAPQTVAVVPDSPSAPESERVPDSETVPDAVPRAESDVDDSQSDNNATSQDNAAPQKAVSEKAAAPGGEGVQKRVEAAAADPSEDGAPKEDGASKTAEDSAANADEGAGKDKGGGDGESGGGGDRESVSAPMAADSTLVDHSTPEFETLMGIDLPQWTAQEATPQMDAAEAKAHQDAQAANSAAPEKRAGAKAPEAQPDKAAERAPSPSSPVTAAASEAEMPPQEMAPQKTELQKTAPQETAPQKTLLQKTLLQETLAVTETESDAASETATAQAVAAEETGAKETDAEETGGASAHEPEEIGDTEEAGAGESGADAGAAREGRPAFDIVRVEPSGDSLIAGRAAPRSDVTVMADDRPLGTARANDLGEFVLIPSNRLDAGDVTLTLKAAGADGASRESAEAVIVARSTPPAPPAPPTPATKTAPATNTAREEAPQSPESDQSPESTQSIEAVESRETSKPMAVAVPRDGAGPSRLLQTPVARQPEDPRKLAIRIVQYTTEGGLVISGRAQPGREIVAYLDDDLLGRGRVGADGRWSVVWNRPVPAGLYTLAAEMLDKSGESVAARVETPFASQPMVETDSDERLLVVQPGHNLWTIARRSYGAGVQYTTIYNANADQIADPDLIYPGQVFVVPEEGEEGGTASPR